VPPAASIEDLRVDRYVQDLFDDAVRDVGERRSLPCNISAINDVMRHKDRSWHVSRCTGGNFSQLCRWFEREGLVMLRQDGSSVTLM
jgi:hypothetical protein